MGGHEKNCFVCIFKRNWSEQNDPEEWSGKSPKKTDLEEIQSNIENLVFEHFFLCNRKKCEGDYKCPELWLVWWEYENICFWQLLFFTFLYERKYWELRKNILKIFTISGTLGEGRQKKNGFKIGEICITYNTIILILFPLFGHLGYSVFRYFKKSDILNSFCNKIILFVFVSLG